MSYLKTPKDEPKRTRGNPRAASFVLALRQAAIEYLKPALLRRVYDPHLNGRPCRRVGYTDLLCPYDKGASKSGGEQPRETVWPSRGKLAVR